MHEKYRGRWEPTCHRLGQSPRPVMHSVKSCRRSQPTKEGLVRVFGVSDDPFQFRLVGLVYDNDS